MRMTAPRAALSYPELDDDLVRAAICPRVRRSFRLYPNLLSLLKHKFTRYTREQRLAIWMVEHNFDQSIRPVVAQREHRRARRLNCGMQIDRQLLGSQQQSSAPVGLTVSIRAQRYLAERTASAIAESLTHKDVGLADRARGQQVGRI